MPRNNLTDEQKDFIRKHAELGGNTLAQLLSVDRGQIYQYATNEKFSVKKGGKALKRDVVISEYKRGYSFWPKNYRHYKKVLVERDGLRCHYCEILMTYREAQVDHVLAKARGGTDAPTNLVLACAQCNHIKSTLCYTCPEFRNAICKEINE
jgi:hypothetical protein